MGRKVDGEEQRRGRRSASGKKREPKAPNEDQTQNDVVLGWS